MAKVYTKPGSFSAATIAALKAILNIVTGNSGGDARGANAADFQVTRANNVQVAGGANSFIAGGSSNLIQPIVNRDAKPDAAHAEGYYNSAHDWQAHAEGSHCYVDGKISHGEGNTVIVTANDSHGEGNRNVIGRRHYPLTVFGSEDAGDSLGVLQYVIIPDLEGDVTSYFPNKLTNNITTRYGAGATIDDMGNIYPPAMTRAVWSGEVLVTANNLRWAMHSICILRGVEEVDIIAVNIKKATYTAGTGTKVYYAGAKPFTSITAIYSSYAATLGCEGGPLGGNGLHGEGVFTSAWGYASHAEGYMTRAWGPYAHAEGNKTKAIGLASNARGSESLALRPYQQSFATGKRLLVGDNQSFKISYSRTCVDVGWWQVYLLENCEDGKAYHFETMVLGRQTAGSAGVVGDTFAYKFQGCFKRSGSTYTVIGTPIRTLIGRSAGMAGDGLTTAPFVAWKAPDSAQNRAELSFTGILNTTFWIQTLSTIQEIYV